MWARSSVPYSMAFRPTSYAPPPAPASTRTRQPRSSWVCSASPRWLGTERTRAGLAERGAVHRSNDDQCHSLHDGSGRGAAWARSRRCGQGMPPSESYMAGNRRVRHWLQPGSGRRSSIRTVVFGGLRVMGGSLDLVALGPVIGTYPTSGGPTFMADWCQ